MKSLKIGRRLPGGLIKIDDHEQKEPEDRKPPGRGPLAISPTLKEVIFRRASEIIYIISNVKFKGQLIRYWELIFGPTNPTFHRHPGRTLSPAIRPR